MPEGLPEGWSIRFLSTWYDSSYGMGGGKELFYADLLKWVNPKRKWLHLKKGHWDLYDTVFLGEHAPLSEDFDKVLAHLVATAKMTELSELGSR